MKFKQIESEDTEDYGNGIRINLSTDTFGMDLDFIDGETEDNTLSRNFGDCYFIQSLVKAAYEAGLRGEPYEEELEEVEWDDFF